MTFFKVSPATSKSSGDDQRGRILLHHETVMLQVWQTGDDHEQHDNETDRHPFPVGFRRRMQHNSGSTAEEWGPDLNRVRAGAVRTLRFVNSETAPNLTTAGDLYV
ncbi:MAG: hypothetical protein AAGA44_04435 [Pseudomonadota bacterium]